MRHRAFKTVDEDVAVVCCEILAGQEELRSQVINGQKMNADSAREDREQGFLRIQQTIAKQDAVIQAMLRQIEHQSQMIDALAHGKPPPAPLPPSPPSPSPGSRPPVPRLQGIPQGGASMDRRKTPRGTAALIDSGIAVADRPRRGDSSELDSSPEGANRN